MPIQLSALFSLATVLVAIVGRLVALIIIGKTAIKAGRPEDVPVIVSKLSGAMQAAFRFRW